MRCAYTGHPFDNITGTSHMTMNTIARGRE